MIEDRVEVLKLKTELRGVALRPHLLERRREGSLHHLRGLEHLELEDDAGLARCEVDLSAAELRPDGDEKPDAERASPPSHGARRRRRGSTAPAASTTSGKTSLPAGLPSISFATSTASVPSTTRPEVPRKKSAVQG